jgi:hypothetical protein
LPAGAIDAAFWVLLVLSGVCFYFFLVPKFVKHAFWLLIGLNVFKVALMSLDFRMRLNQHIMAFWITLAFLFFPNKTRVTKLVIVLFYFWAGMLKLNHEWLSGSALYEMPWFVPASMVAVACTYVVILEIVFAWLLLLDRTWLAWATFAQLCLFHFVSFPVVGFFYPMTMYAILAIFPLTWLAKKRETPGTLAWLGNFNVSQQAFALALVFSALQLIPRLMPGDTALTGEGRLFALHMFDTKTVCEAVAIVKNRDGTGKRIDLDIVHPARIHCDPIVYLSRARNLCEKERATNPNFANLDLSLRTRRSSESELQTIVNQPDFCGKELSYSLLSHNDWIIAR